MLPLYHQVLHEPAHYERFIAILENAENDTKSAASAAFLLGWPFMLNDGFEGNIFAMMTLLLP